MASPFDKVNREITDDIKRMLRLKGHYDLGNLERSLKESIVTVDGVTTLSATALGYIDELEVGVDAGKVDESKIDKKKLAAWVSRKISNKNPEGIAHAIIQKWKKVGKPTNSSSLLTIEETFRDNQNEYGYRIDQSAVDQLDKEFHNTKDGLV